MCHAAASHTATRIFASSPTTGTRRCCPSTCRCLAACVRLWQAHGRPRASLCGGAAWQRVPAVLCRRSWPVAAAAGTCSTCITDAHIVACVCARQAVLALAVTPATAPPCTLPLSPLTVPPALPRPQAHYRDYGKMTYARCAFVIHNMAHQVRGVGWGAQTPPWPGLPPAGTEPVASTPLQPASQPGPGMAGHRPVRGFLVGWFPRGLARPAAAQTSACTAVHVHVP
jgi:hypothetical protein